MCSDRRRFRQQAGSFWVIEADDLRSQGIVRQDECPLTVQYRRIRTGGVIEAVDLAGGKRELDDALECRVRVGVEIGERGVRNLAGPSVQRQFVEG
jgi:hypothetical protein